MTSFSVYADTPRSEYDRLLLRACDTGDTDSVRELLERGANPNASGGGQDSKSVTEFVVRHGGGDPVKPYSVLIVAVIQGNEDAVKLLLEAGADLSCKLELKHYQRDALECACLEITHDVIYMTHAQIARTLVAKGIDTRSHALVLAPANALDTVEFLLDYPQTQPVLNKALFKASHYFYNKARAHLADETSAAVVRLAQRLLAAGAEVNAATPRGKPLMEACSSKNTELVEFLIKQGADIHVASPFSTPLRNACKFGVAGTIDILLKHGAVPTAKDLNETLSWGITQKDDAKVLAMLRGFHQHGVDPRTIKITDRRFHGKNLLETLLQLDLPQSARFLFDVLGENPGQRSKGGASLMRLCGPQTKAMLLALRTEQSIQDAMPSGDPKVKATKTNLGML